ncbi:MAG: ATP-binding protein [Candidatus Zixiibacteriota bacterium]
MRRKRLLWQIYPSYLLITVVSLIAVSWYAYHSLRQFYHDQIISDLQSRAILVERIVAARVIVNDFAGVDALCKELGTKSGSFLAVVAANGTVIGDSREDVSAVESQAGRTEIVAALSGTVGVDRRFSSRFNQEMIFVAVPIVEKGAVIAVVRSAMPVSFITDALRDVYSRLGVGGMIVLIFAAVVSMFVARNVSKPLEEIKSGAERIAHGDLESRVAVPEYEEIAGLAIAMNKMASQLNERFLTMQRQTLEQEAVVSSMLEGVLAIDAEQRLMSLNTAAARLLGLNPSEAIGRSILEVIRNNDLQRLVTKTFLVGEPVEGDVTLSDPATGERHLQAHGTLMRDSSGVSIGALMVLNDVTRLRKLENLRRDFVANVSHELKTPITSIKGFVETLLEGQNMSSEEAQRFLQIIARQADRLHAIIEDLLKLSRIEQESERGEIALELGPLVEVLQAAITSCEQKAAAKGIKITLQCDAKIHARVNAPLLEQAMVNLIENAVKYSEPNTEIRVSAASAEKLVSISVQDHGQGIAKEHLPRLFERFYTVDKARSRAQGGTGLGLAIAKHIVMSHGGNIGVTSEVGNGSTFTISIPRG